jgi:hypothetical protein
VPPHALHPHPTDLAVEDPEPDPDPGPTDPLLSDPETDPATRAEGVLLPFLADVLLEGDDVVRASLFSLFDPPDPDPDPDSADGAKECVGFILPYINLNSIEKNNWSY